MEALEIDPVMGRSVWLTYGEDEALVAYAQRLGVSVGEALRGIVVWHLAR